MVRFTADSRRLGKVASLGLRHIKDLHAAESEDGFGLLGAIRAALGLVFLLADGHRGDDSQGARRVEGAGGWKTGWARRVDRHPDGKSHRVTTNASADNMNVRPDKRTISHFSRVPSSGRSCARRTPRLNPPAPTTHHKTGNTHKQKTRHHQTALPIHPTTFPSSK